MMDGVTDRATGEALDRAFVRSCAGMDIAEPNAPSGAEAPSDRGWDEETSGPVAWLGIEGSEVLSLRLRMAQIGESLGRAARAILRD